jgi:hypothetical protein
MLAGLQGVKHLPWLLPYWGSKISWARFALLSLLEEGVKYVSVGYIDSKDAVGPAPFCWNPSPDP